MKFLRRYACVDVLEYQRYSEKYLFFKIRVQLSNAHNSSLKRRYLGTICVSYTKSVSFLGTAYKKYS